MKDRFWKLVCWLIGHDNTGPFGPALYCSRCWIALEYPTNKAVGEGGKE